MEKKMDSHFDLIAKDILRESGSPVFRDCVEKARRYARIYGFPFNVYHTPQMPHSHAEGSMLLSHIYLAYKNLMQWVWKKDFTFENSKGEKQPLLFTDHQKEIVLRNVDLLTDWIFLHDIGKQKTTHIFLKEESGNKEIPLKDYFRIPIEVRQDPRKFAVIQDNHEEAGAAWIEELAAAKSLPLNPLLLPLIRGHILGIPQITDPNALFGYYQKVYFQMGGDHEGIQLLYLSITLDIISRQTLLHKSVEEIFDENRRNFSGAKIFWKAVDLSARFNHIFKGQAEAPEPTKAKVEPYLLN